jgi:hypothetical protein
LLLSVVAAALAVGTALVYAEPGGQPGGGGKGSPGAQTPDTPPAAGEKKSSPKAETPGSKEGTKSKEGTQPKRDAEPKTNEPKSKSEPKSSEPKASEPKSKNEPKAGGSQNEPDRSGNKGGPKSKENGRSDKGGGGTNVNISVQQRTEIRQTLIKSGGPRVDHVDFDVRVGVTIPRTVKVAVLPATVVKIYPQWRGYRYFIIDEKIVIVEPDRLVIVYIIEA